ncbi:MAG TPA: ATP-binding cassette domain-containing protein [Cytophagaceae bacterium]|nr:ATP-binding cassette domain-containing protein [Cytophagaceae bacterium]
MIQIENLSYSYKKKLVFEDLSVNFEPGNIYGLLGKNGTGKSTLFRNICGLLKPKQGKITVFGYSTMERSPEMLSKLFLLPEEFFVPAVLVKEFTRTLSPFYPRFSHEDFTKLLTEMEVPHDQRMDRMSMGQKKKLLIAFSLSTNTELLLMDEPTNGLDIVSKTQFKKVMSCIAGSDKCIVISTHQVKDIEDLVNRICVIDKGKILFNESINTIGQKISFLQNALASPSAEIIFSEETLHGVSEMILNRSGSVSKVDMEMLYKAVMVKPEEMNKLFKA